MQHWKTCPAPICAGFEKEREFHLWYPDERVCGRRPFTKWQKTQMKIQKLFKKGLLKYPYSYYTVEMLERKNHVGRAIKGRNPDQCVE